MKSAGSSSSRRYVLRAFAALGAGIGPWARADSPAAEQGTRAGLPPAPPATLEQKLQRADHVMVGVTRRFVYAPQELFVRFQDLKKTDAVYAELLERRASDDELRRHWQQRVDPAEFSLREASQAGANPAAFIEFEIDKVLFRNPYAKPGPVPSGRIYVSLPRGLYLLDPARRGWEAQIGRKVVLLTGGRIEPRSLAFVPYSAPIHSLPPFNHWMDPWPLSFELLPTVLDVAQKLRLHPVEKP
jgi:hypothetical protein